MECFLFMSEYEIGDISNPRLNLHFVGDASELGRIRFIITILLFKILPLFIVSGL